MSRSRRFLLFSPLVVLTLFLGACGWRNWNLSMDEEEVFAAVAADYRVTEKRPVDPIAPVTGRISMPFIDNEITLVGRRKNGKVESLSGALMTRFKQGYPKARMANISSSVQSSECTFYFENIRLIDRFQARCQVSYVLKVSSSYAPYKTAKYQENFLLKRSPINLVDSSWKVVSSNTSLTPEGWRQNSSETVACF